MAVLHFRFTRFQPRKNCGQRRGVDEKVRELEEAAPGVASSCFAIYLLQKLSAILRTSPAGERLHMDVDTAPHGPVWHGAVVLVVDDEAESRTVIRRMLEDEGFRVEEADSGEAALRIIQARSEPFDLVLTDLSMPLIDGREVSETLARYRPSVAILGMSGNPDAVPHIGPFDIPFRVMLKPFTPEDLYHAVRDAITRQADLASVAEEEIVRAHAELSRLARALEESRTMRVHTLDLVVAARELRRALPERRKKPRTAGK